MGRTSDGPSGGGVAALMSMISNICAESGCVSMQLRARWSEWKEFAPFSDAELEPMALGDNEFLILGKPGFTERDVLDAIGDCYCHRCDDYCGEPWSSRGGWPSGGDALAVMAEAQVP